MPFNGSGVFVRNYSWVSDATNSIPITASRMDADTNDIAQGLTDCITRDGQSPALANIPMGGFRFTNVANAVNPNEYITLSQGNALYNATLGYTPVNKAGDTMTGGLTATGLTAAVAGANEVDISWTNNGVRRFFGFVDSTSNTWGLATCDGSGAFASTAISISRTTGQVTFPSQVFAVGGATITGTVITTGAGSGFQINDRTNSSLNNTWYATGGTTRLFTSALGSDVITITNASGATTVTGVWSGPNFIGTSDRESKSDISYSSARSHIADHLSLADFTWKADGRRDRGLIAQDVVDIAPEYVYENEGVLGLDKAMLALEAVIGLAARVRVLEGDFK